MDEDEVIVIDDNGQPAQDDQQTIDEPIETPPSNDDDANEPQNDENVLTIEEIEGMLAIPQVKSYLDDKFYDKSVVQSKLVDDAITGLSAELGVDAKIGKYIDKGSIKVDGLNVDVESVKGAIKTVIDDLGIGTGKVFGSSGVKGVNKPPVQTSPENYFVQLVKSQLARK